MATRPDVYLSCRDLAFLHVSIHADPRYWHLKAMGEVSRFRVPRPLAPGYFQAVEIRIPGAAIDEPPPSRAGVYWHPAPAQNDPWWVRFHVMLEPVGANLSGWPGSNTGASFVGRVGLSDGRTACVVATVTDAAPVKVTMPLERRGSLRKYAREAYEEGRTLGAITWGPSPDAGIWILIGRADLAGWWNRLSIVSVRLRRWIRATWSKAARKPPPDPRHAPRSRTLGHADLSTKADVYAHLTATMLERSAARMEGILARSAADTASGWPD